MKLEKFSRGLNDSNVREDLLNGKIHMVFVALNGLTLFNAFCASFKPNPEDSILSMEEANKICNKVNDQNKAETLHPKLSASLLPLSRYKNPLAKNHARDSWNDDESMKSNVLKILEINSTLVKCKDLIFIFDQGNVFNIPLALDTLQRAMHRHSSEDPNDCVYYVATN